jgi:hypothetical protein
VNALTNLGETETERQTERQTERDRQRETERERDRQIADQEIYTGTTSNDSAEKSPSREASSRSAGPQISRPFEEVNAS